jgi:hypothetical protein
LRRCFVIIVVVVVVVVVVVATVVVVVVEDLHADEAADTVEESLGVDTGNHGQVDVVGHGDVLHDVTVEGDETHREAQKKRAALRRTRAGS